MRTDITEELIYEEYIVNEKTMQEIACEHGCSLKVVRNRMREYGIPVRNYRTERSRKKISLAKIGCHPKPYERTEEWRQKISKSKKGKFLNPSEFGGHRKKRKDGYVKVFVPDHPNASKDGYVMEHVLVIEKHIGRYVEKDEVVHHINHIRDDNRIENLLLMTSKEHAAFHMNERKRNGTWKIYTRPVRNITTGETFESIKTAGEKYNIAPSNITMACKGKIKTCGGYQWRYERRA